MIILEISLFVYSFTNIYIYIYITLKLNLKVKTYNRVLGLRVIRKIYKTICGPFFEQVLSYLV